MPSTLSAIFNTKIYHFRTNPSSQSHLSVAHGLQLDHLADESLRVVDKSAPHDHFRVLARLRLRRFSVGHTSHHEQNHQWLGPCVGPSSGEGGPIVTLFDLLLQTVRDKGVN